LSFRGIHLHLSLNIHAHHMTPFLMIFA